jgi:Serine dehydrogenase proteinase
MQAVDLQVKESLRLALVGLEEHFDADCIFFYGPIYPTVENKFRDFIEHLLKDGGRKKTSQGEAITSQASRLVIFLNTPGGSAEAVEKLVEIIRFHYDEVYFVVPDAAMSAGTIFCMAGDKIFMDYSSSLGPIDPQVHNGKDWVPALGYLDQVDTMIKKSMAGTLSEAELVILQNQDLAMLSRYEQAKNLTITLLKKWLVEFKFKNWTTHGTTPAILGQGVTPEQKQARAEEIATILSNNKLWHSHGRMIGIATITNLLKLRIEDYSTDNALRSKISPYNALITDYIRTKNLPFFLHSRCYF